MTAPLQGIRVLDFTRILAGPFATMKLGDMGAEVIKIERPGKGDDTRAWGPPFAGGESTYFLALNRNKNSLSLDLQSDAAREILGRLVQTADVVVQNFRPGTLEKLGFSEAWMRRHRPDIIYCSISGYGDDPTRAQASYDLIIQGESGLMDLTGHSQPTKSGISIADLMAGQLAVEGILLALFHRLRNPGEGQKIEVTLLEGLLSLFTYQGQSLLTSRQQPVRMGNAHPSLAPYESYRTADGEMTIGAGSQKLWRALCEALGKAPLADDPLFATNRDRVLHRQELKKELESALSASPVEYWLTVLQARGIPCGPIRSVTDSLQDPRLQERGFLWELEHSVLGPMTMLGNPIHLSRDPKPASRAKAAPLLGQHTRSILEGLGYSANRIQEFQDREVI